MDVGPSSPNRRGFLGVATAAVGAVAAVLFAVPVVGYLLGPLRKKTVPWVKLGTPSEFPIGETRPVVFVNPLRQPWDGMTANTTVYVRNQGDGQFLVLGANCAHLGCPVTWFPQSGLFMCPCHGGVYYETGERASGPPPRGLFPCKWHVKDGQVEIEAPHFPTLQNPLEKT
jgi:Rieske Fe-S protein